MRRLLWLFALATAVEVVGVALDRPALQWLAKPLMAPLLIAVHRRRDLVTAGLVGAFGGDVILLIPGQTTFLLGMLCFLGTQVCFLVAFLRRARPPVIALGVYATLWIGLNAALWGMLGPLRIPILVYSLALTAMAAAATGVSRRVAVGGALFLLSDLLIGVGAAGLDFTGRGVAVMITYGLALALITVGMGTSTLKESNRELISSPGQ